MSEILTPKTLLNPQGHRPSTAGNHIRVDVEPYCTAKSVILLSYNSWTAQACK